MVATHNLTGGRDRIEWRVHDVAGGWHWVESRGSVVQYEGKLRVMTVCRDISERRRAEQALRKSERVLREAEELGHTGSWEHDLVTGEIFNTDENLRLFFGDDRSEGARFEDYIDAVHPDDRAYVRGRHAQLLAEGGPHDVEFRWFGPIEVSTCWSGALSSFATTLARPFASMARTSRSRNGRGPSSQCARVSNFLHSCLPRCR